MCSLAFQLCSSLAQDAPAAEAPPAEAPDEEKPVLGLDGCGAHVTSRCVNFPFPLLQAFRGRGNPQTAAEMGRAALLQKKWRSRSRRKCLKDPCSTPENHPGILLKKGI